MASRAPTARPARRAVHVGAWALFVAGLLALAEHVPAELPRAAQDRVRAAVQEAAPEDRVTSVQAYWRPVGLHVVATTEGPKGPRTFKFHYDSQGRALEQTGITMGSVRGVPLYLAIVSMVVGISWIAARWTSRAIAPKCPSHRIPLVVERRRLWPGGVSRDGLRLPAIDLLTYVCPRGDYTRRRVVEGRYNPSPEPAIGPYAQGRVSLADLLGTPAAVFPEIPRRLFRQAPTDAEWRAMFEGFRAQYED